MQTYPPNKFPQHKKLNGDMLRKCGQASNLQYLNRTAKIFWIHIHTSISSKSYVTTRQNPKPSRRLFPFPLPSCKFFFCHFLTTQTTYRTYYHPSSVFFFLVLSVQAIITNPIGKNTFTSLSFLLILPSLHYLQ